MDLVVDANILFSALIKDGFTQNILFSGRFRLFTPEHIFSEFDEHKEEILKKTKRTFEELCEIIELLKRRIDIIPLEEIIEYINKAETISPDPEDVVYFALALKLNCALWSNDKKLKQQNEVKVYHTHELVAL